MTILLIEDDPFWQIKILLMLEEANILEVTSTGSLKEAQDFLSEIQPDLVLADVMLPDGLSYDLFKGLKREYPVIFLTGYPQDEFLKNALSLPNTSFLVKPFHPFTLLGMVHAMVPENAPDDAPKGISLPGRFRQKIFLAFDSLLYIEADGNYVHIYTSERNYIFKRTLRAILFDLDKRFVQVHRAFVVNKNYVKRLDLSAQQIIVQGKSIPVGRSFRQDVIEMFEQ